MARYGMVIYTARCVGCKDCVVACKTQNEVPEGFNRDWIAYETRGRHPTLQMEIRTERCKDYGLWKIQIPAEQETAGCKKKPERPSGKGDQNKSENG